MSPTYGWSTPLPHDTLDLESLTEEIRKFKQANWRIPLLALVVLALVAVLSLVITRYVIYADYDGLDWRLSYQAMSGQWRTLPNTNDYPQEIYLSDSGTAWMQSERGLHRANGKAWEDFTGDEWLAPTYLDGDTLWSANADRIVSITGDIITRYPMTGHEVLALAVFDGEVMIIDDKGFLTYGNDGGWQTASLMRVLTGLSTTLTDEFAHFVISPDGYLWLRWHTLWRYDGTRWQEVRLRNNALHRPRLVGFGADRVWLRYRTGFGYILSDLSDWDNYSWEETGVSSDVYIEGIQGDDVAILSTTENGSYTARIRHPDIPHTPWSRQTLAPERFPADEDHFNLVATNGVQVVITDAWKECDTIFYLMLIVLPLTSMLLFIFWTLRRIPLTQRREAAYADLRKHFPSLPRQRKLMLLRATLIAVSIAYIMVVFSSPITYLSLLQSPDYDFLGENIGFAVLAFTSDGLYWLLRHRTFGQRIKAGDTIRSLSFDAAFIVYMLVWPVIAADAATDSSAITYLALGLGGPALLFIGFELYGSLGNNRAAAILRRRRNNYRVLYDFAMISYAEALLITGKYAESERHLWISLMMGLKEEAILRTTSALVTAIAMQERYDNALMVAQFAIALEPRNPTHYAVLASLYIGENTHHRRALALLEFADTHADNNPNMKKRRQERIEYSQRALLYAQLHRSVEAYDFLKRLKPVLRTDHPVEKSQYHLLRAQVDDYLGSERGARENYQRVLELDPTGAAAMQARAALAKMGEAPV